jgi:hypothetical protein
VGGCELAAKAMLDTKYEPRLGIINGLCVGLINWAWIAACLAAAYFLLKAAFFRGSWRSFILLSVGAWLLYRAGLYYQLEEDRGG